MGLARLKDAQRQGLALESQFDLAYNAAHALCLAALRWHGYRSGNRFIVFQLLPHTLGLGPEVWRVLSKCHDARNLGEYEGMLEVDTRLVADERSQPPYNQTIFKSRPSCAGAVQADCGGFRG